jgi:5-methylcytosine-specific restriction endonuclease McrA
MYSQLNRLVLVLNGSYEAVNVCPARRAMTLLFKGAAVVEEVSKYTLHTDKLDIPVPSVIRLVRYRRIPRLNRSVSRKGIMLRDHCTCQYCGSTLLSRNLTMDHVTPKSRGGLSTWENLVAACFPCNNKKGDRTPAEAGMKLMHQPRQITINAKHKLLRGDEETWDRYIFA